MFILSEKFGSYRFYRYICSDKNRCMSRPSNPDTPYRITLHVNGGYRYATTRPLIKNDDGTHHNRSIHWGKVTEDLRFIPGSRYLYASLDERRQLIFPEGWDLSEIDKLPSERSKGRPANDGDDVNRFYGDIWLLERIAEKTGIRKDLEAVFCGNQEMVNDIMTLAMYPYVIGFNYNRVARWQRIVKTPSKNPLTPCDITKLTQNITEQHRMDLFRFRAQRVGRHTYCAMDSTTRSAYGDSLADIKWGKNKEKMSLPQTLEVVVYTLDDHMPIYYRTLQGNIPDSRTVDVIMKDLDDAGFGVDLAYITDRGYESQKNIEQYILSDRKVIMSIKVGLKIVRDRIKAFGDFGARPAGMEFDSSSKVYFKQYDVPYEVVSNGGKIKKADRLHLNLYFDPIRRGNDQLQVDLDVAIQGESLEKMKKEGLSLDNDMLEHDYPYYRVELTKRGRIKAFELDVKKRDNALEDSGFFANFTHKLDISAPEALAEYKRRDEQEKYFQQMKSQMVSSRQRNWSEEGKTGRLFILFVSLVLGSYLRHIWKTDIWLKENYPSSMEILDEMRAIRCVEHKGRATMITPFVGDQLKIAAAFGFTVPDGCEPGYNTRQPTKIRGRPRKHPQK